MKSSKWRIAGMLLGIAAIGVAQDGASVSGRVTNAATGAPLLRAHVTLFPMDSDGHRYGALTDGDGKFSIGKLPAGKYSFSAEAAGFQMPPVIPDDERTDTLQLEAGDRRGDLNIALTPLGAISGRVLDADGHPVQGVTVNALGVEGFTEGDRSDPRGEYRLANLAPGRYRVRAEVIAVELPPEIRSDGTTEVRYASTYYPDSATPVSATPLDVLPGAERSGIDIRLVRAPIVAVRGTVSGMEIGADLGISARPLESRRRSRMVLFEGFRHRVNPDGSFAIWGLGAGSYLLTARTNDAGSAPVEVTVAGKNVDGVQVTMVQDFSISGRVLAGDEGSQIPRVAAGASLGEKPQISLQALKGGAGGFSVVEADGSFGMSGVQAGRYEVRLGWGAYVQSMQLGSTNVEGDILDLRGGSGGAAVTVTASSATAEVTGVVRKAAGTVAHACVAVLEEGMPYSAQVLFTDTDGMYTFSDVRPGKYQLLVLPAGTVDAFAIRDQLFDYADIIETVEVHAGERVIRDLRQHESK